jgi:hypothetical protein
MLDHAERIEVPAHQARSKILRQDYDRTLTDLYQIERNVRSICQYIESLKK